MTVFRVSTRAALLGASVFFSPLLIVAPAAAQDAQAGSQDSDTIVVTARRREEALIDVPVAVTAIGAAALDQMGAQDITAVSQSIPNITLENSRATNSTLTAFIRGVGQQDPVAGFEQGVGVYLDDVYLNRPQAAVLDIYDVERVEVLRGPQGTLYGRNTIGGAVKYVTRRIDADEASLRARVNVGSYDQLDFILSGSVPVSDTFRIGAAVAGLTRSGFGTINFTGEDNYNKDVVAERISAEWEPTADLLVRFAFDHTSDNSTARQGYRLLPSAVTGAQPLDDHFDSNAGITTLGPIFDNHVEASGGQVSVDWSLNDAWTLKSITAYRRDKSDAPIDFDSTPLATFDVPAVYTNKQFSQEFQAIFEGDRLTFVGGAYYLDANAFDAFDVIFFASSSSFTLGDVDTKTWAVFGEATYDLTDTLSVTLGGRYTEDERTSHVVRQTFLSVPSPYFGGPGTIGTGSPTPSFNGTRQDDAFTPRVIVAWKPGEDLNLYASYSEGFKGGGFDPRGNFANADVRAGFEPETVKSYEIGAKTRLFDGRANINADVFFADYTDVQIPGSVIVAGPPVSFVGTVTNAGGAEMTGVEFESTFNFTDHLRGALAFGYIDAKYTEFLVNGVDISDQRDVQNTPDWTGNTSLTYATAFGEGEIAFTGSAAYRGDTQQFENPIPLLDQQGYWLYDASVTWISDNDRWRLGLYGRNLSDERYITSGYNFPTVDSSVLAFYGNPRTVTAGVEVRF